MTEEESYRFLKEAIARFDSLMADPHPGLVTWNLAVAKTAALIVRNCEEWHKTWSIP
jgi:hypothetical protein